MESFTIKAPDNSTIFYRRWLPESASSPRAVVQIAHGMTEHSQRYDSLAGAMTEQNIAVYANDHRGHGFTAGSEEKLGFFAETNGWPLVVGDMESLSRQIKNEYPGVPFFLLGHSMGSFLVREYMARHGENLAGVILTGTAGHPGILGRLGLMVARIQAGIKGPLSPSPLMDKLFFGNFAKAFAPARTPFDWLTRDPDIVDEYIRDPFCGFICRAVFFADLLSGLLSVSHADHFRGIRKDLPILFVSGTMDPVGNFGKGVQNVHDAYENAGLTSLTLNLYDQGRHEMINEINKDQVTSDILEWIDGHL